jgi:thiosulfate reductase cytochrome b subunit
MSTTLLPLGGRAGASLPATTVHPLWLRLSHWLNVVAVVLLVLSGWRIYNATAFLGFTIPKGITLGGWLGGAIQWHFAAMWLLGANGLVYVALNLMTGRAKARFWPLRPAEVLHDLLAALRGRLAHADLTHYNAVQKLAYLTAVIDLVLLVLSGLVLWKSVQFPLLRELLGGYEGARLVHFIAMAVLCAFIAVHVLMVALVPRTLRLMVLGR